MKEISYKILISIGFSETWKCTYYKVKKNWNEIEVKLITKWSPSYFLKIPSKNLEIKKKIIIWF
jgi:hypothetical protein